MRKQLIRCVCRLQTFKQSSLSSSLSNLLGETITSVNNMFSAQEDVSLLYCRRKWEQRRRLKKNKKEQRATNDIDWVPQLLVCRLHRQQLDLLITTKKIMQVEKHSRDLGRRWKPITSREERIVVIKEGNKWSGAYVTSSLCWWWNFNNEIRRKLVKSLPVLLMKS